MWQHFKIAGTGLYLPRRKLTAEDVDRRAGVPAGWARAHIGVLVRYECAPPETLATMAREAVTAAMQDAALDWRDLDLILDGSACRHQPVPCNAVCVQHDLGAAAQGIPCLDIQSTCLGFVLALHLANALFATGSYRHILIVCSEGTLLGVNWRQPESACLMGDGAAAAVLRRAEPSPTYCFAHQTFSEHLEACQIRGGGFLLPPSACTPETEAAFRFHTDGPRLLRIAGKYLPPMTAALVEQAGLTRDDLHVFPHQAVPKALALVRRLLGFRRERFHQRVAQMGNLTAASIPAVFHQCRREGIVSEGDRALLLGTSAGYSQAGLIFQV